MLVSGAVFFPFLSRILYDISTPRFGVRQWRVLGIIFFAVASDS